MKGTVIIGVDPGKVTGLAFYVFDGEHEPRFRSESIAVPMEACARVRAEILTYQKAVLAVERFNQLPKRVMSAQNDALEIIGVMKWFAHLYDVQLVFSGASEAARFGSTANLKKLGWYTQEKDGHQNRAAAQVLIGLMETSRSEFSALLTRASIIS